VSMKTNVTNWIPQTNYISIRYTHSVTPSINQSPIS